MLDQMWRMGSRLYDKDIGSRSYDGADPEID
jgi:hypothetical protein